MGGALRKQKDFTTEDTEGHGGSKRVLPEISVTSVSLWPYVAFTPHDLRRTAATFMAAAGEMDEVIDAVLSHSKQGIIGVYNRSKYDT